MRDDTIIFQYDESWKLGAFVIEVYTGIMIVQVPVRYYYTGYGVR